MKQTKKLIEVALPLEAINIASAREKSIRHGHPSTLHLWWARRPLAACRAVLFASIIDDPDQEGVPQALLDRIDKLPVSAKYQLKDVATTLAEQRRNKLFGFIDTLVQWENSNNPDVLKTANELIMAATDGNPPPVLDPFCGGGSIPLEAQRLGLEAHGSDLNPVPVLITKALIEIPPKFAGQPPINPDARADALKHTGSWLGAKGLAEDVRYYGKWMRDEAEKRIGHLYPKAVVYEHRPTGQRYTQKEYDDIVEQERTLIGDPASLLPHPTDLDRQELTVIAWIWARTVKCPNPACGIQMPLVRSFALSTKSGKEAWIEPIIAQYSLSRPMDGTPLPPMSASGQALEYAIKTGKGKVPNGTVSRAGAKCIACDSPVPLDYVRSEGKAQRMGAQMMAIVAEGQRGRIYLPPQDAHEKVATSAEPEWSPDADLPKQALGFRVQGYGMTKWSDLFTKRQLAALTTLSDLVGLARANVKADAVRGGLPTEKAQHYADAVATYLALGISRLTDICNSLCRWENTKTQVRNLFTRQAIPMLWDYAEPNIFSDAAGDFKISLGNLLRALVELPAKNAGRVEQLPADQSVTHSNNFIFSTDPPYYDNVPYADLSDFFYVWLRRSLQPVFPTLLQTMLVPKAEELVADPFRHGGQEKSRKFFEAGMFDVFASMRRSAHQEYPVTVYYAFKQAEEDETDDPSSTQKIASALVIDQSVDLNFDVMFTHNAPLESLLQRPGRLNRMTASTGWETMLEGLIRGGFQITGTWPMRTELSNRMRGLGSNALASSIVLVCRPRPQEASIGTRREFVSALRRELEDALIKMMHGNIAPVDLAQATIGPGMAVYSRYSKVIETNGEPLRVRAALQIINQELDTVLSSTEGDYDGDTRFCVNWFEQFGMNTGAFGDADNMARARNTSVSGLVEAGVLEARSGNVRLLKREEYPADWNPQTDTRKPIWECTQYLVRALMERGEGGAARLCAALGAAAEPARDLAYRLYSICERKGWAQEALAYNSLVIAWPEITQLASNPNIAPVTGGLFDLGEDQ